MYKKELLDYAKNRAYQGDLEGDYLEFKEVNPLCGDKIILKLKFKNNILISANVNYESCAIVSASANILLNSVLNKSKIEILSLIKDFNESFENTEKSKISDFNLLIDLREFHSRKACIFLPFKALGRISSLI